MLFAGPWIIAFALFEEHVIAKNKLLTTIPTLKKEWRVSFELKASNLTGITQVLHMTAGGRGYGPGSKYGDRTPAIWISAQRGFYVSSAVEGKHSYGTYTGRDSLPSVGKWIMVKVSQQLEGARVVYSIAIGGKKVFSTTNSLPSEFSKVKVFISSNWYAPQSGFIKNFLIENKNDDYIPRMII